MCGGSSCRCISDCNPRAPCGARRRWRVRSRPAACFQSTRPMWGATPSDFSYSAASIISIHAPVWARRSRQRCQCRPPYFNPRAHTGRDGDRAHGSCGATISIHAPTRGATVLQVAKLLRQDISIHAPTRGATGKLLCHVPPPPISIHAPTRGATEQTRASAERLRFQSTRPAWGRDIT